MPTADWYFDFVSPFSYLQSEQLPTLGAAARDPLPAGAVRRAAQRARAQGPGGDPGQARVHLSLRASGRRSSSASRSSFRPSTRSIRCRCCGWRSPATARPTPSSGSSASSGATAGCPTCRSNGPSSTHDLGVPDADARIADAGGQGRAAAQHRRGDRARRVRRADARDRRASCSGAPTRPTMARDYVAAGCRWTDPEYAARRRAARRRARGRRHGAEEADARGRHGELTTVSASAGVPLRRSSAPRNAERRA